jgi:hypothetical protein
MEATFQPSDSRISANSRSLRSLPSRRPWSSWKKNELVRFRPRNLDIAPVDAHAAKRNGKLALPSRSGMEQGSRMDVTHRNRTIRERERELPHVGSPRQ